MSAHHSRFGSQRLQADQDDRLPAIPIIALCVILALLVLTCTPEDEVRIGEETLVTATELPAGARDTDGGVEATLGADAQVGGERLGQRIGEGLVLTPRAVVEGQVPYQISSASDPAVLARTRLRIGDILFDVDDRALDHERIRHLGTELSALDRVEITFERDGLIRNRVIDLTR